MILWSQCFSELTHALPSMNSLCVNGQTTNSAFHKVV